MTLAFGSFDESYPPEVLRGYVAPVLSGGAARRTAGPSSTREPATPMRSLDDESVDEGSRFTVTAGTPGSYEPEVPARERPRNVTELRAHARPATRAPWAAGEYVLVGATGKRAHWSGDDWHGDESPGYEPDDDDLDAEPDVDEVAGDAAAEEAAAEADARADS